jgi:hypothetical protein
MKIACVTPVINDTSNPTTAASTPPARGYIGVAIVEEIIVMNGNILRRTLSLVLSLQHLCQESRRLDTTMPRLVAPEASFQPCVQATSPKAEM